MAKEDDILSRLQNLEDSYYGDKEATRRQNFMDTYGGRFSNNRGLGMAILNELDARGVDTSAADEAVQEILDNLRTECNEIIESIKDVQQDAIDAARKVEAISDVVDEVVSRDSDATSSPDLPMGTPEEEGGEEMPTPDGAEAGAGEEMPMPEGAGAGEEMPMPDEGGAGAGEEMPMPEGAEGAEGGEAGAGEEVPPPQPTGTPSDARIKRIKGAVSDIRMKRIKAASYKPSAGIIEACNRGF